MDVVTKAVGAENTFSDALSLRGDFSLSIAGTSVGTVTVQRSFDAGSSWANRATLNACDCDRPVRSHFGVLISRDALEVRAVIDQDVPCRPTRSRNDSATHLAHHIQRADLCPPQGRVNLPNRDRIEVGYAAVGGGTIKPYLYGGLSGGDRNFFRNHSPHRRRNAR